MTMNSVAVADIRDCCSPALAESLSWIMDQIRMLTTVEVTQMEVHSAGSTIVGVGVGAAAEHAVVAAAVAAAAAAVSESAFASIPQAKQAEEEIAIATTGPVDSGPKYSEGKAVAIVVVVAVAAAAAASEAVVGPIHSDSHFD